MSATWYRRVLYQEGPSGTAMDRTTEKDAVHHLGPVYHGLVRFRYGDGGEDRYGIYVGGGGRGRGPSESHVLVLPGLASKVTISSTDPQWAAARCAVSDLPASWQAAWPRTATGTPITPGTRSNGYEPLSLPALQRALRGLKVVDPQLRLDLAG